MQSTYIIEGMTCQGCVAKVKKSLEELQEITSADIQLQSKKAQLNLLKPVSLNRLQTALGKYHIQEVEETTSIEQLPDKSITTYRPLLLIVAFIIGVTLLVQYPFDQFSGMLWMRHFMAAFFIVFAFFKFLDLKGFAQSFKMYDILAARSTTWAYLYPFVELSLGILYLINVAPILTNWLTIIILGIGSVGVIQSNLNKKQIKCACLGTVFNLPMSTVTIVEDLSMVLMAAVMLFLGT